MRKLKNIMVTGGAGFIGTNFIRHLYSIPGTPERIVNADVLTYAGRRENLLDIEETHAGSYRFERIDICDAGEVRRVLAEHEIDTIVHFAAESHVDRSIDGPADFMRTNILGTFTLLEAARDAWAGRDDVLFHHVSTDEVYGSLGGEGYFHEDTPYDPRSPYSASKASSDHLVRAYHHTYGVPVTVSNCSNNYGPYQYPEKLIPLLITNMMEGKPLPVYGDGRNIRDWLYVDDHARGIWTILRKGATGSTYNIGGENEWENIRLVHRLCETMAAITGRDEEDYKKLITFVKDRPGHDRRYAINCDRIKNELGWNREVDLDAGLDLTIRWYLDNNGPR